MKWAENLIVELFSEAGRGFEQVLTFYLEPPFVLRSRHSEFCSHVSADYQAELSRA